MDKIKIGLLRETKNPPDRRVALSPNECVKMLKQYPEIELHIQKSEIRCFSDKEYTDLGLSVKEDISDCELIIGVKEVKIETLIPNKKYIFFGHVAKKQPYNRDLLQAIIAKNLTFIDYEYLTLENGARVVAFGHWAGVVGAYNGLRAYGLREKLYDLKPAHTFFDMKAMYEKIDPSKIPPMKILITGGGRVAQGAMQTLNEFKIKSITIDEFLNKNFDEPVYCQIDPDSYVKRKDGEAFDLKHFFANPKDYVSTFLPYTKVADMYIPCHFWDPNSPDFILPEDMKADDFNIKVIADVSCDIKRPIPSTIRASTIADPFFDYNPQTEKEEKAFSNKNNVTVCSVDNLPGELPRDASGYFGDKLLTNVIPSILDGFVGPVERGTIVKEGKLTPRYAYLQDFADGKE